MDAVKADMSSAVTDETMNTSTNPLYDKWVIWAHLPHDTDWSIGSYKKIMTLTTVEEAIALYRVIPEKLVKNCMLFLYLILNSFRKGPHK